MRASILLAAAAFASLLPAGLAFAQSAPARGEEIRSSTHAQWVNAPHSNEMVWPGYAFMAHMSGHVRLDCVINDKGKLKPCAVVEETPKGQGFAEAALSFLEPTKMRPPTVDGAPVQDAHVQIMIDFLGDQQCVRFMWRSQ
ncbi:MAG: TonB family protein [Caulobacteraceae bacterium]